MGIFGTNTTYDNDVERATGEGNTSDDWVAIMHVCDRLTSDTSNKDAPRECLKAILKRMKNAAAHVALQALTLLDACGKNCGRPFRLELASRMFEDEARNILSNSRVHAQVREKLKLIIKQWAHDPEIIANPELKLIPEMYKSLAAQGYEFPKTNASTTSTVLNPAVKIATSSADSSSTTSVEAAAAARRREEEDFARAIALSIKEAEQNGIPTTNTTTPKSTTIGPTTSNSLYGNILRDTNIPTLPKASTATTKSSSSANQVKFADVHQQQQLQTTATTSIPDYSQAVEPKRYRVLYDFEAAEEDELTLKAGEIVLVNSDSDKSDANWWKGSNPRGEGLFPANFVTDQLDASVDSLQKKVQQQLKLNYDDDEDDAYDQLHASGGGRSGGKSTPTKSMQLSSEPLKIDEQIIDRALQFIHDADLTGERPDDDALAAYEMRSHDMAPLIDAELEQVDRQHMKLTQLGQKLFDAIKLYHETMAAQQQQQQQQQPQMQPQQQSNPFSYQNYQYNNNNPAAAAAGYQHQQQQPQSQTMYSTMPSWPPASSTTVGGGVVAAADYSAASQQPQNFGLTPGISQQPPQWITTVAAAAAAPVAAGGGVGGGNVMWNNANAAGNNASSPWIPQQQQQQQHAGHYPGNNNVSGNY